MLASCWDSDWSRDNWDATVPPCDKMGSSVGSVVGSFRSGFELRKKLIGSKWKPEKYGRRRTFTFWWVIELITGDGPSRRRHCSNGHFVWSYCQGKHGEIVHERQCVTLDTGQTKSAVLNNNWRCSLASLMNQTRKRKLKPLSIHWLKLRHHSRLFEQLQSRPGKRLRR